MKDAVQIRLQVAHNALESVAMRMDGWAANCRYGAADEIDADQIIAELELVRAALAIARGVRTDIPPGLRGSTVNERDQLSLL